VVVEPPTETEQFLPQHQMEGPVVLEVIHQPKLVTLVVALLIVSGLLGEHGDPVPSHVRVELKQPSEIFPFLSLMEGLIVFYPQTLKVKLVTLKPAQFQWGLLVLVIGTVLDLVIVELEPIIELIQSQLLHQPRLLLVIPVPPQMVKLT
jgi:hypothetical protein